MGTNPQYCTMESYQHRMTSLFCSILSVMFIEHTLQLGACVCSGFLASCNAENTWHSYSVWISEFPGAGGKTGANIAVTAGFFLFVFPADPLKTSICKRNMPWRTLQAILQRRQYPARRAPHPAAKGRVSCSAGVAAGLPNSLQHIAHYGAFPFERDDALVSLGLQ